VGGGEKSSTSLSPAGPPSVFLGNIFFKKNNNKQTIQTIKLYKQCVSTSKSTNRYEAASKQ